MNEEEQYPGVLLPEVWKVERLNISGEELPVIRHVKSWNLAPLALRYILRTRFLLGLNSLVRDAYAIALAYNWAETVAEIGNLEEFLISGFLPRRDQVLQLADFLRRAHRNSTTNLVSNQVYNSRLFAVCEYFVWAMEPANHGGTRLLNEDQVEAEITKTQYVFNNLMVSVGKAKRLEPITDREINLIRRAVGPDEFGDFPPGVFTEETRYRNWVMFEKVINFGDRKGELLATKLEHIDRARNEGGVFIPRQQDDESDPRRRQPRGKTLERFVSPMSKAILPALLCYSDSPPPVGRNNPDFDTPYLFVTEEGNPLSTSAADYIIKQIGRYAARLVHVEAGINEFTREAVRGSLLGLSWHRVRHTWAEQTALGLYGLYDEGAWPILQEWGGWSDEKSMEHYIKYARRKISDQAAREYQAMLSLRGRHA